MRFFQRIISKVIVSASKKPKIRAYWFEMLLVRVVQAK